MKLEKILRPHLINLVPYSSARDDFSGKARIYLDANENAYGSTAGNLWNRYPDPYQKMLKEKIASLKEVKTEQVFIGNGSDEPIDLLIRAFCIPGTDHLISMPPTYGMYGVSSAINQVENVQIPLTSEYELDVKAILNKINDHTKLIFICSPNNPTGNSLDPEAIKAIIQSARGLVVLDEAYIDYSSKVGFLNQLDRFPNLVILHTLSKAWGMAALRLGMAFAHKDIITVLNKIKPPYNISGPVQEMVLNALQKNSQKEKIVKQTLRQREILKHMLLQDKKVIKVFPSDANFLLVKLKNANQIYRKLIDHEVIVRDRSRVMLCEDCLRITVGTPEENKELVKEMGLITNYELGITDNIHF